MLDDGNKKAINGVLEAENSPLAITDEIQSESKEEVSDVGSSSGAWKNSQKQKSKKAKKID